VPIKCFLRNTLFTLPQKPNSDSCIRLSLAKIKIYCTQIEQPSGNAVWSAPIESIRTKLDFSSFSFPRGKGGINQSQSWLFAKWQGRDVWIEWGNHYFRKLRNREEDIQTENRMRLLTELLREEKPDGFRALPCLGYVKSVDTDDELRFGIVFEKPASMNPSSKLVTLREILQNRPKPSLSARTSLCVSLAECIQSFHAVNWLYKGLGSENIVFFEMDPDDLDIRKLYVSGFALSRPNAFREMTAKPEFNPLYDIYRHPDAQSSETDGSYRKSFDMYSLGIVLIEIANWKRIEDIMGIEVLMEAKPHILSTLRSRLLETRKVLMTDSNFGDSFRATVEICLRVDEVEKPIYIGESDMSISIRLQRMFAENIIGKLRTIEEALKLE
ncbi:hypothetical protein BJ875DRAFT_149772, partial [Amylocarpus encephaloides]